MTPSERATLARELLASLDDQGGDVEPDDLDVLDDEVAAEVAALARQRSQQLDSGEAVARDYRESLEMARAEVAARSAARNGFK